MEKKSKNIVMEHDPGQPAPFVFPYSKSEYPYVLVLGLSRPLTAGNIGLLFEAFPKALITPQGTVVVPRSRKDLTGPLMKSLEQVEALALLGFTIQANPY